MEYSAEIYESKVKVKTVVNRAHISIQVEEKITGSILNWDNLNLTSLYLIQMLYSVIRELPYKLATAIKIFALEKKSENGYHSLAATVAILTGLVENENLKCDISLRELKNELDTICYMLRKRLQINMIYNQINVFLLKCQAPKIACHIFLNFSFGELLTLQTMTSKNSYSPVHRELWTGCFQMAPCTILYERFHQCLQKNAFKV